MPGIHEKAKKIPQTNTLIKISRIPTRITSFF